MGLVCAENRYELQCCVNHFNDYIDKRAFCVSTAELYFKKKQCLKILYAYKYNMHIDLLIVRDRCVCVFDDCVCFYIFFSPVNH